MNEYCIDCRVMIESADEREVAGINIVEFQPRSTKYAVLIPVLNEGQNIFSQLERMRSSKCPADIIVSDGGSHDGSTEFEILSQLQVRTLLVTAERGLGAGLRNGVRYVIDEGYEGVITIDGNGKDGVDGIARFIEMLDAGIDLVQGSRFIAGGRYENTPWDRLLGIRWFIAPLISVSSGFRYTDPTNGFKGISRKLLCDRRMALTRSELSGFNFQFYLNYRAPLLGFNVLEIPVTRVYPKTGPIPTKIVGLRFRLRLVAEFLWTILGFYNPPRDTDVCND